DKILRPLKDGSLPTPYTGAVALDGNLTLDLLDQMARSPLLAEADLRVAPASPGKALRLSPFILARRGTLYVNLEEAGILCQTAYSHSADAARGVLDRGALRVVVTDGASDTTVGSAEGLLTQRPPQVTVTRITGAGDTFMAAHIAAERRGLAAKEALDEALSTAALYVSGEVEI
ncbi:MAG: kinase, partial [Sulfitobacter sp.]|nr:kinase [Sulfitobacter sp.]